MTAQRLDQALVARGLARSRNQAQQLVRAGVVTVDGTVVDRPSTTIPSAARVELAATPTADHDAAWITRGWVGRGALKLDHALTRWEPHGLRVAGRRCIDVGASTGGFTQVLLERGAAHVVALDVGHDQLDERLVHDDRVSDRAGTSVRTVTPAELGGPFDVVVADLSFISLALVLPQLAALAGPDAELVLLVKPQFEVGREALGRAGVVRSARARHDVLAALDGVAREAGLAPMDLARSPVSGTTGNVEYLWWLRVCPPGMMDCGRTRVEMEARRRELREEERP